MSLPDAARWARLSPLLDELLDLDLRGRASRMHEWQKLDPEIAKELQAFLDARAQVTASGLLEGVAEFAPTDAVGAGSDIGAYRLEAVLGEGGSGTVWRARRADGQFDAVVAIKLLHFSRTDGASLQRFRREARILAKLAHPNIARLFDAGVAAGGRPYLVLELVDGRPLDVYADAGVLTVRQRVELFRQVTLAVAHAHSHLTVHRDIKPNNILVDREGVVKLLDFGIAKLLDAEADGDVTLHGGRLLTPAYAAPEQLSGGELTTATDVYALGIVLHQLLARVHPTLTERSTVAQAIRSTLDADPVALHVAAAAGGVEVASARGTSPQRLVQQLRGDLCNIVARCLRKAPEERYTTAAELGEDLRRYLDDEPVQAGPDSLPYRTAKFIRKYRVAVSASVLTTAILIVATTVSIRQTLEAKRQHTEAVTAAEKAQAWSRLLTLMVIEIGADDGPKSPTQIIDQGMYLLDQSSAETPSMVEQLMQMSGYYKNLEEASKQRAVLERAEALARKIGDEQGLARVLCNRVDVDLAMKRRDRARAALDEAQRIIAAPSHREPVLQARCEIAAAVIEDNGGRSRDAIIHAERALSLLRVNDPPYGAVATRLSKYHDDLGDPREAHRYTEVAVAAMESAGEGGTLNRLNTLNNEAVEFMNFGQLADALNVADKVMQRLEARGASPALGVTFSANRSAILSALGRYDEALALLDRTIEAARASKNSFMEQRAKSFRAQVLTRSAKYGPAREAIDEVERTYRLDETANKSFLQSVTTTRALWLLHTGDVAAADALMRDLLQSIGYPGTTKSWVLRGALPVAAEIALAGHDAQAAQSYASAAVANARSSALDPSRSADLGRALVLLGKAQRAAGLDDAGSESIRQAVPSLAGGLGPEHAEVRDARLLLASNETRAKSPEH